MQKFDVLARIQELCEAQSLNLYRLAKQSQVPYSSLTTLFRKNHVPTIHTLFKICDGFGITPSQFFDGGDEAVKLTKEQRKLLCQWNRLDAQSRKLALAYMEGLEARQEK